MKVALTDINETAVVERLDGDRIRVEYKNGFYGECRLRVQLAWRSDGGLQVSKDHIEVEECRTRCASAQSLIFVVCSFLVQRAAQGHEVFKRTPSPHAHGKREVAEPALGWGITKS